MTECGGIHSSRPEDVLPGINLDNSVYKKNSCQVFFFFCSPRIYFRKCLHISCFGGSLLSSEDKLSNRDSSKHIK